MMSYRKMIFLFVVICLSFVFVRTSWAMTWGEEEVLSFYSSEYISNYYVASNGEETIAVWRQSDGISYRIYMSLYQEGDWSEAEAIDDEANTAVVISPVVSMNANGDAVVAWIQSDGTSSRVYSRIYEEGTWSEVEPIDDATNYYNAKEVDLKINDNNSIVAAWYQSDGYYQRVYARVYREGAWESSQILDDGLGPVWKPFVDVNQYGNAVVSWHQEIGSETEVYVNQYNMALNSWGVATALTDTRIGSADMLSTVTKVVINDDGNVMVAWHQTDGTSSRICTRYYDSSGWDSVFYVDDETNTNTASLYDLDMNDSEEAVVLYQQDDSSSGIPRVHASIFASGVWSTPETISSEAGYAQLPSGNVTYTRQVVINESGDVVAVWQEAEGPSYSGMDSCKAATYQNGAWYSSYTTLDDGNSDTLYRCGLAAGENEAFAYWSDYNTNTSLYEFKVVAYEAYCGDGYTDFTEECDDGNDRNDDECSTSCVIQEDADGDGYYGIYDCDDTTDDVNPATDELCDGIDNDCDGEIDENDALDVSAWYHDADGDGYGRSGDLASYACDAPTGKVSNDDDCDDTDASVYPGVVEICGDSIDNDCDGTVDNDQDWYLDSDSDGYGDSSTTTSSCAQPTGYVSDNTDCDDSKAAANPGEDEVCDGIDNDCDGVVDGAGAIDVATWYLDSDSDGYGDSSTLFEGCLAPTGYVSDNTDCDDTNASINPGAVEVCSDGVDNDCDGTTDVVLDWYLDDDGDGYGDASTTTSSCAQPTGYVLDDTDCDDSNAEINPGEDEVCDDVDNDCDGSIDGSDSIDALSWYDDDDGDGYGDSKTIPVLSCGAVDGRASNGDDCDDNDASINPGESEVCGDGVDNDCDGTDDEEADWYLDDDGDGYGDPLISTNACDQPEDYVSDNTDCDDTDATINPNASEIIDGVDNDCDGIIDSDADITDDDGDGESEMDGDCDDTDASIHTGATEICDAIDNDCDGSIDEEATDATTWYADSDSDGYGNSSNSQVACLQPTGYVSNATDCNDTNASIKPGASETCDGADNDCDGSVDEGATDMSTWYLDSDSDGYGDSSSTQSACSQPTGYVSNDDDCDDTRASVSPDGTEVCGDGLDNDCSGGADGPDATDASTWYVDNDSDGYGYASTSTTACTAPIGFVSDSTDCDDADADVNPGADEICSDGVDNDCDGSIDESCSSGGEEEGGDDDGDEEEGDSEEDLEDDSDDDAKDDDDASDTDKESDGTADPGQDEGEEDPESQGSSSSSQPSSSSGCSLVNKSSDSNPINYFLLLCMPLGVLIRFRQKKGVGG